MRDEHKERFPSYIPFYCRLFVKARKIYRQGMVRERERRASKRRAEDIVSDGEAYRTEPKEKFIANPEYAINKSALWLDEDMARPEIDVLAKEINALKEKLVKRGLCFTTTAATFLSRMFYPKQEKNKLWENAWVIHHSGVKSGNRVLDIGGASTTFSFYLASIGCDIAVVDNDWNNCGTIYNTNYVAKKMGWMLKAYDRDIVKPLPFRDNYFDYVFSICVLEHLSSSLRRFVMKEIGRVLKPSGIVGFSIDYFHNRKVLLTDKGLRFAYRDKLERDVIRPSGLSVYGNKEFIDGDLDKDFLGTLFLKKP